MPEIKFIAVFVGVLDELQIERCEDREPLAFLQLTRLPVTDELQLPADVTRPQDVDYKIVAAGDWVHRLGRVYGILSPGTVLYIEGQYIPNIWLGPIQLDFEWVQVRSVSNDGIEATYIALFNSETLEVTPLEQLLEQRVELSAPSLWSSLRLWFRSRFLAPGA